MDSAYTELERICPIIYHARPHWKVGWAVLHGLLNDESVPFVPLLSVARFLVANSQEVTRARLLGGERILARDAAPDTVLERLGIDIRSQRGKRIVTILRDEAVRIDIEGSGARYLPGLLGQTDDRGMARRRRQLLTSGAVKIVVFGHTHRPFDGNVSPPWGSNDPRRWFNTGSWMPTVSIGEEEWPTLKDLGDRLPAIDARALLVGLGPQSGAALYPVIDEL